MLNPFPDLLTYGLIAPTILRLVAGFIFINLGYLKLTRERDRWMLFLQSIRLKKHTRGAVSAMGTLEIICGVLLLLGAFTQYAALILLLMTAKEAFVEYKEEVLVARDIVFYVLIGAILLSLLFSGAGFFAFDLPL